MGGKRWACTAVTGTMQDWQKAWEECAWLLSIVILVLKLIKSGNIAGIASQV